MIAIVLLLIVIAVVGVVILATPTTALQEPGLLDRVGQAAVEQFRLEAERAADAAAVEARLKQPKNGT